jgi:drug/metabolite transporter (DMT)-like permease
MYISPPASAVGSTAAFVRTSGHGGSAIPAAIATALLDPKEDGGSPLQRWSSLIGIITAIVGNILISFALNIQRYAHIRIARQRDAQDQARRKSRRFKTGYGTTGNDGTTLSVHTRMQQEDTDEAQTGESDPMMASFMSEDSQATIGPEDEKSTKLSYLHSPYWWAGIVLMTIGETGNFLAYGFAPASIVSPLGVVALISNCVIAPIMLKERFRWRDFFGVVVAVGGAVTVVLSAKQKEKKLGPHEVIGAITTMEFEIYMGVTFGLIGVLAWASPRYGQKTSLIDLGLVGLFGGYTALSTKGVSSMLSSTFFKAFTTPITYALLAVLISTAIMQVKYVNKALARFDSTQVIPVQFVMFTLSVIIGSAILYRDFENTNPERMIKFVGGCLLTFFGVYLITGGRGTRDDDDEWYDEEEEEQQRIRLASPVSHQHGSSIKHSRAQPLPSETRETFDGADDDGGAVERRTSRVSFAEPPTRPELSHRKTDPLQPQPPAIRVTTPSDEVHNPLLEQGDPDDDPALTRNPWRTSTDSLARFSRAPSAPVLPTTSTFTSIRNNNRHAPSRTGQDNNTTNPRPQPPNPKSKSQDDLHTPLAHQSSPAPPQADVSDLVSTLTTQSALHSLSMATVTSHMLPGPLISPLSSSLSAVVADELRRGVDGDSVRSRRNSVRAALRKRSLLGLRRHGASADDVENEAVSGTSRSLGSRGWGAVGRGAGDGASVGGGSSVRTAGTSGSGHRRGRSLSNALQEFWRGRGRRESDVVEDSEAGEGTGGPPGGME